MNGGCALFTGIGLGLVYFGGLWLGVRQGLRSHRSAWMNLSRLLRTLLFTLTFALLSREGLAVLLAGLTGFWLARWHLLRRLGGQLHGQQ